MDSDDSPQFTFREKLVICFYEFLGTAMLVLGYNFTSAGLAVGFNLFVGILISSYTPVIVFAVLMPWLPTFICPSRRC